MWTARGFAFVGRGATTVTGRGTARAFHWRRLDTSPRTFLDTSPRIFLDQAKPRLAWRRQYTQSSSASPPPIRHRSSPWPRRFAYLAAFLAFSGLCYEYVPPARHFLIANIRCARLVKAVVLNVIDYKYTFIDWYPESQYSPEERKQLARKDRHACHARSSHRLFLALKRNAGIYVKLGQHIASVQALPVEWTSAMKPLQDQCFPSSVASLDAMLRRDMDGLGLDDLFESFDPIPIGVASLAQVHRATDRRTGRPVAVKLQHPHLEEFVAIDIATVKWSMQFVKRVFPDFEFSWLGQEMTDMLPLEMDFVHEASNADRARTQFEPLQGRTALYIPETLWAEKRCMVMEYIDGARIDDLAYLHKHSIDRNQVSQQLTRIFSQMVYIDGFFHADPHHGNLLIRPKPARHSHSPFNFEIVLLDHGQYFDLDDELRTNYARFWLSLIQPSTPDTIARRKYYAQRVANVSDDLYPILETAITGRIGLEGATSQATKSKSSRRSSLLDLQQMSGSELDQIRSAVTDQTGLITSIFTLLRNAPRRLIMILKLNDLSRGLDQSLHTTHGPARVFLIVARFCEWAVWQDEKQCLAARYRREGVTWAWVVDALGAWWGYQKYYKWVFFSSCLFASRGGTE